MPSYDLVLVHAPSVYDFRKLSLMPGPVADVVPSTPVFEMYPIGFITIASLLAKNGYRCRILNLASHMLADRSYDVERAIRKIRSKVFGIDLHWLPHAQGSLEIAKLIKREHPESKVVMGGFSATYYHDELLKNHPYVDAVFLGDSTELPMLKFMRSIDDSEKLGDVPNLAYRENGRIRSSGITHIVRELDDVEFDYGFVVRSTMRSLDLTGHLPYLEWKRNPMLFVSLVRGCAHDCTTCMGSCKSFQSNFRRDAPAYRSPEKVFEDIRQMDDYFKGAIFLSGDIQQPGESYAEKLLSLIREDRPRNEIGLEFFTPPGGELVANLGRSIERFNAQISPDSHDPVVRAVQGRRYSNESMEASISNLLRSGAKRVDLFFMIGLSKQTEESVSDTVKYCRKLMLRERAKGAFLSFISPLAPFLDPGSDAFNNPEKYGYRIFARTLEEHRSLLTRPSWKHVLNYETEWMNRNQIANATHEAGLRLNEAKLEAGAIDPESAERVRKKLEISRDILKRIDESMNSEEPEHSLYSLRDELGPLTEGTLCNKKELDWSSRSFYWSIPRMAFAALFGR